MSYRPLPGPTWVWVVFVGVCGAGFVALLVLAILNNRTAGEPAGRIDLAVAPGSIALDLAAQDVLHFRIDGVFVTPPGNTRDRKSDLDTALRASTLKVRLAEASGAAREVTCAANVGGGQLGPVLETTIEKSMVTECRLAASSAGRHAVSASVAWAAGVVVRSSSVQVNVEPSVGR